MNATVTAHDVDAELAAAIRRAMSGIRDPEIMRQACAYMDQTREEIRRQHGALDIGVPAIRELRGQFPDA